MLTRSQTKQLFNTMFTRSQTKQVMNALANYSLSQINNNNNNNNKIENHIMTKSPPKQLFPPFEDTYDFDEASLAWRSNKKPKKNGCYTYICSAITKTGKKCNRASVCNSNYCHMHTNPSHK